MKIIHTGDIHLDSPFTSLNPIEAEKRRNALRAAFSSMILYAKTEKVELFLGNHLENNKTEEKLKLLETAEENPFIANSQSEWEAYLDERLKRVHEVIAND